MKTLAVIVLAATTLLSLGASATATLAAAPTAGRAAPFCDSNNDSDTMRLEKSQLALQLHLRTKQSVQVDDWANCFKVSYIDQSGHQVVALYDPDTLNLIETLS